MLGDGSTGAALLESDIDKLIFPNFHVATGKQMRKTAAARLLPVILLKPGRQRSLWMYRAGRLRILIASSGAVWAAFMNAGQTCLSVERCYVHRSIYQAFVAMCEEMQRFGWKRIRPGD